MKRFVLLFAVLALITWSQPARACPQLSAGFIQQQTFAAGGCPTVGFGYNQGFGAVGGCPTVGLGYNAGFVGVPAVGYGGFGLGVGFNRGFGFEAGFGGFRRGFVGVGGFNRGFRSRTVVRTRGFGF